MLGIISNCLRCREEDFIPDTTSLVPVLQQFVNVELKQDDDSKSPAGGVTLNLIGGVALILLSTILDRHAFGKLSISSGTIQCLMDNLLRECVAVKDGVKTLWDKPLSNDLVFLRLKLDLDEVIQCIYTLTLTNDENCKGLLLQHRVCEPLCCALLLTDIEEVTRLRIVQLLQEVVCKETMGQLIDERGQIFSTLYTLIQEFENGELQREAAGLFRIIVHVVAKMEGE